MRTRVWREGGGWGLEALFDIIWTLLIFVGFCVLSSKHHSNTRTTFRCTFKNQKQFMSIILQHIKVVIADLLSSYCCHKKRPILSLTSRKLYKNYSNNRLLKDIENSNKVALNLKINEKFKHIWFGNILITRSPSRPSSGNCSHKMRLKNLSNKIDYFLPRFCFSIH